MFYRILTAVVALAVLPLTVAAVWAHDASKYPDLKGEWRRVAVPSGRYFGVQYDPHKPAGPGQEAPLTPEYQAIFEANLADQALGGQAGDPTYKCMPPGMPRIMAPYGLMEIDAARHAAHHGTLWIDGNRRPARDDLRFDRPHP